jgi:hypothetical protein
MKNIFLFIIVLGLGVVSCRNTKEATTDNNEINKKKIQNVFKKVFHYGYGFTIPTSFALIQEDVKSVDLNGKIKKIENVYMDTLSSYKLSVNFFVGESGIKIYEFYRNTEGSESILSKHINGVKIVEKITKDGRGNDLKDKKKRILVFFINNKEQGTIQIVFDCLDKDEKADEVLNKIIQEIKQQ